MDVYTVSQTAALLDVSAATVRRWTKFLGAHLSTLATPGARQERTFTTDDIRAMCYARDRLKRGVSLSVVNDELSTATLPQWADIVRESIVTDVQGGMPADESALVAVLTSQHAALARLADGLSSLVTVGTVTARLDAIERQLDAMQRQLDDLTRDAHIHREGFPYRAVYRAQHDKIE